MRRHSRASGNPARSPRPKSSKSKSRNQRKAAGIRPSRSGAEAEVAQLRRELDEAREQQTATADVLRVISNSPTEIEPVLDAIVRTAGELCASEYAMLFRLRDEKYHVASSNNAAAEYVKHFLEHPIIVDRGSLIGRTALERRPVHIVDCLADPEYKMLEAARLGKHRTMLGVPLLRDGATIGVVGLLRTSVKPFTEQQIKLVENFAAEAVIAIENTRLLSELRQRTDDLTERTDELTEALEQQTATSEVLQVISSSPVDLEPVFSTVLEKAVRICDASFGNIHRWDGDALHLMATHNTPPAFAEYRRRSLWRPNPTNAVGHAIATKTVVQIADIAAEQAYIEQRNPSYVAAVELGGIRTLLAVPMLKENELIGVFTVYRQEVRPFSDKQIELVKNFAAQAVIAIENARLLNELRQRTTDLTEALEQQTATSEVLSVISRSPTNTQPVFDAIVESAARLCDAVFSMVWLYDGKLQHFAAGYNTTSEALARVAKSYPKPPDRLVTAGRAILDGKIVHVPDTAEDREYSQELAAAGNWRAAMAVPMLRDGKPIGAISLGKAETGPFLDRQIQLLTTFADQAVIAIENTRLLNELRERTQEVETLNQQLEQRVADQVGEIERMGRLRRFLPPQVADLIVASGTEKQLESHRREITALFCDLRGFTGFSESADPEDVSALLREYHAAIGEKIIKYSGTLERYAGDGVMVVFNDPVPVENPALQAVLMALEMRDAIGALTETWRRWGHDIGFGIGIAHGFATLGTIGFEGRFDYAAIGTVANVASRLCDEAKPGQILISPRVLTKVENAVTVEPVGEFTLKGIRRPLAAYNVLVTKSAN